MKAKQIFTVSLILGLSLLILIGCSQLQQALTPGLNDNTSLAGEGVLSFSPSNPILEGKTQISLKASSVRDLKGYSVILSYDPDLLRIEEITEGDFLSSSGETFFYQDINPKEGTIQIDCALLGRDLAVYGAGTMAKLSVRPVRSGMTSLNFKSVKVRNHCNKTISMVKSPLRLKSR